MLNNSKYNGNLFGIQSFHVIFVIELRFLQPKPIAHLAQKKVSQQQHYENQMDY